MANIFTEAKRRMGSYIKASPRLQSTLNFMTHPTIWRVAAVAFAVATTVMSGGATIPLVSLGLVFGSSLIGVVGKALQLRHIDNLKLQKAIISGVKKVRGQVQNHSNYLHLIKALGMKGPETTHTVKVPEEKPSKFMSALKTFRDVGLENVVPVAVAGLTFNVPGLFGYVGALTWGITRIVGYSGAAAYTLKSEFDARVEADQSKVQLKADINELCGEAQISPFRNVAELREHTREEIVRLRTLEHLCKIEDVEKLTKERLQELYNDISVRVRQQTTLRSVPHEAPLIASMVNAVNPFGTPYKSQEFAEVTDGIGDQVNLTSSPKLARTSPGRGVSPVHTPKVERPREIGS